VRAGQFLFTPTGVPHLPFNPSDREACIAVLARTDPMSRKASCCATRTADDPPTHANPAARRQRRRHTRKEMRRDEDPPNDLS
jgi:hypothetical protein